MLGPATNERARLPCMIEPPSTKRSRGTSATNSGLYDTWKSTLSVPIRNATTNMCGNVSASKAYASGSEPIRSRAAEVGGDHDLPLVCAAVGPGACVQREEQVRRQLGGDEVAHLRRGRVEREHRHEGQRDQADLIAEQRDRLPRPEAAELLVLAEKRGDS